jgi:hypothetical protein
MAELPQLISSAAPSLVTEPGESALVGQSVCASCGAPTAGGAGVAAALPVSATGAPVYAVGRLEARFRNLGVEKEFQQLGGWVSGAEVTNDQLLQVLGAADNDYLARCLCWVFVIGGVDAFAVEGRDSADYQRLTRALPPAEDADKVVHAVVGSVGSGISDCDPAGGPAVLPDMLLWFTVEEFLAALHEGNEEDPDADEVFRAAARDLFDRLTKRTRNRGLTDEHRALNYVTLRYSALYRAVAEARRDNKSLVGVDAHRLPPSGARRLAAVRLVFRSARTDIVEKFECVVDVTDRFPFLVSALSPVFD